MREIYELTRRLYLTSVICLLGSGIGKEER